MVSDKYIKCCQWDDENIKGFFGNGPNEYRWLSNFYECKVVFKGLEFNSSEAAFMYGKLEKDDNLANYEAIKDLRPWEVKKWGRSIQLRPDWEQLKTSVMTTVLFDKFTRNLDLKAKLLATGAKYLEESNTWGDVFWGYDINLKRGLNTLGEILMSVREYLLLNHDFKPEMQDKERREKSLAARKRLEKIIVDPIADL